MLAHQTMGKARQAHPVDVHVGGRVRLRRVFLGYSQEKLANALGLTFQQIQKYERGTNRIFASRLFHLARVLRVPVSYFYQGLSPQGETLSGGEANGEHGCSAEDGMQDLLGKTDTLKLIQAYNKITDPSVRRQIYALVKTVGEQDTAMAEHLH